MQRGLIHHRAGQKRLAVVFESDGHVPEPVCPLRTQMALDPYLVDHRLIEFVCHHPVPFVAVIRCTRSIAATRYRRTDTKVWFRGIVMNRLRAVFDAELAGTLTHSPQNAKHPEVRFRVVLTED